MRRACVLLHLLLLAAPAMAADTIFESDSGRGCFSRILKDSGWGLLGPFEHAAFIVERVDGSFDCVKWPHVHSYLGESYHGVVPPGTVAIAHTHPVEFRYPSIQDKEEATRIGLPIYVLTILGVYRTDPQKNNVAELALGRRWMKQRPQPPVRQATKTPTEASRHASER